eukprot:CAMPEP_0176439424 /NCGR_PEP_ID=MMETSP0127-20121128/19933_1 /TAXON_ID=938130 /ORGANISM="Platyophrya macrostoma, Strain WH" /LENGTH=301 /DNA_ID=CAMNT_0017823687 /DNA_START=30 /DNA_END=933 /DNA_ORIENTATION=-
MTSLQPLFERNQEATVYVGNCDQKVTEEILWELFSQCGPVVNVHMPRDKITSEHQGYGFCEFRTEDDADYAIKIMHMIKLFGKPIKVNKASQDKRTQEVGANLFVGNLDPDVDEKMLYDGASKGFGFVSYDNFESSDAAMNAMHGQFFANKTIHVSYAYKKDTERHGSAAERLLAANRPSTSRPNTGGSLFGSNMESGGQGRQKQQQQQQQTSQGSTSQMGMVQAPQTMPPTFPGMMQGMNPMMGFPGANPFGMGLPMMGFPMGGMPNMPTMGMPGMPMPMPGMTGMPGLPTMLPNLPNLP